MGLYTPPYFVPIQATSLLGISKSDASILVSILNVSAVAGRLGQSAVGSAVGTINANFFSPYGLATATGLLFPSLVPGYLAGNTIAGALLDIGSSTTTTTFADGSTQTTRKLGNAVPAMVFAGAFILLGTCVVAVLRAKKVREITGPDEAENWETANEKRGDERKPPERVLGMIWKEAKLM
ncbi:hypothetical protein HDU93_001811 [Gonapodya sp. JEL0774]|nr:hypothetical protein HDU93_001811 [Gonapodya sp. JEL0774]